MYLQLEQTIICLHSECVCEGSIYRVFYHSLVQYQYISPDPRYYRIRAMFMQEQ